MKALSKFGCCLVAVAMAFGADAGLPAGWRELQYVTADGTQYLKTGFRLTTDAWDYILDAALIRDGGYGGVNHSAFEFQSWYCGADGKRHVFHYTKADGVAGGAGSVIGLLALGDGDNVMTGIANIQKGDIYSFVLKKNGEVVQQLVPAKDPNGVACFYDVKQDKPFYSEGSAAFVAGPLAIEYEIAPVPRQFLSAFGETVEPELFVSNKATQVGLVLGEDYTVTYENNADEGSATAHVTGIGYYEGENASVDFVVVVGLAAYKQLEYVTGTGTQYFKTGLRLTSDAWDYILDAALIRDGGYGGVNHSAFEFQSWYCGADGTRREFHFTKADGDARGAGSVIGFLALGDGDTVMTGIANIQKGDVYSLVLMKNGDAVMDLVPIKDNKGVACFYDKVQMKRFYSEGSEQFIAGPPAVEYEIAPVPRQVLSAFGEAVEPELFVSNKATNVELVLGVDYTVTYENNTDGGTATAHITGIGYYEGENVDVNYEIVTSYAAYTHLQYVTGTGTQYFKTGLRLTSDAWDYILDAAIEASGYCGVNHSAFEFESWRFGADGRRRTFHLTKAEGDERGAGSVIGFLALGEGDTVMTGIANIQKGDVYSLVLLKNGIAVMDLAPILDNDGVACFYDKVQMKRFYSEGSEQFIAGPVRSELEIDPIPSQRVVGGVSATPEVTVRSLGTGQLLRLHEDYEVSYENNDRSGIATVRVTGKGAFAGSLENTAEFAIAAVFCVTADAKATGGGLTWADAMPFDKAVAAASAVTDVPCEIWVAGDVAVPLAPEAQTWNAQSVSVRGGFAGTELSPESRSPGAISVLDGGAEAEKILEFANAGPVVLERLVFKSATVRALGKTGGGDLSVVDCRFVSNGLGMNSQSGQGRACRVAGNKSTTECAFSNCVFSGNCMAQYYCNGEGCAIYGECFKRLTIEDCLFVTNGVLPTAAIGSATPGARALGACIQIQDCPLLMRNSHFRGNRGKICAGYGGIVAVCQSCSGSVIENCSFAGSSDGYGSEDVSSDTGVYGGAVVVQMRQPEDTITFNNCTIAYNLADAPLVPGGLDVLRGVVNVSNSVICANRRGKFGQVGADISVRDGGKLNLSYCHLTAGDPETGRPAASCVSETSEGLVTFDHLTFGDPKLKTRVSTFDGCIRTSGDYTYLDNSPAGVKRLCGIDVHERGVSPLVDAGDPASDYANEPEPNGRRVNLGAYGNTPWATPMSRGGTLLFVR